MDQEQELGTSMDRLSTLPDPHWIWDVPFHPLTLNEAVEQVDNLVCEHKPSFLVTANLNYVMLTHRNPLLQDVNNRAAFVLADGITLVWASRWKGTPLPERVTGADLIYDLCDLAARRGYGIFLLGGAPGVGETAARKLAERYAGLRVIGIESPPYRDLSAEEEAGLIARIRSARPDILLLAFTQPKGELWIDRHLEELGVPAVVQVGAAFDFAAGRVRRAPRWIQRIALETPFRIIREPRRLTPRYTRNALFLIRMILHDARGWLTGWVTTLLRAKRGSNTRRRCAAATECVGGAAPPAVGRKGQPIRRPANAKGPEPHQVGQGGPNLGEPQVSKPDRGP
jgi:N-acetylglucosaminyldiphosphoundecaprenol N-acetyl-beta-D-mannosaminyltransferase